MKKLLLIVVALVLSVPAMTTDAGILKNLGKAIVKDQAKKMVAESKGQKYETRLDKYNKYHPEYVSKGRPGKFNDYIKKQEALSKKASKKATKKVKKVKRAKRAKRH